MSGVRRPACILWFADRRRYPTSWLMKKKPDVRWILAILIFLLIVWILIRMAPIVIGWLDAIPT